MTKSRSKQMTSWDASRQQTYRAKHPEQVFIFHVLLDGSGSMYAHEAPLRSAYNMYVRWLQRHAPAMSLLDTRCFGSTLQAKHLQALATSPALDSRSYSADYGGTALYDSLGQVVTQASEPGHHVLIVFTDGLDYNSTQWSVGQVRELLQIMQADNDWLCVFLGAFPQALEVGASLGFAPGNCLVFGTERIPEAFEQLKTATALYLQARPAERKLLAQHGVFEKGVAR